MRIDDKRLLLIAIDGKSKDKPAEAKIIDLNQLAKRASDSVGAVSFAAEAATDMPPAVKGIDVSRARVELRTVERLQAFVDGKPVGAPFP